MGQGQSSTISAKKQSLSHPKFKQTQILADESLIRTKIAIEQQSDFDEWERKLNEVATINQQVLLLPQSYQYTKKGICGGSGIIHIDYECYPYILSEQLRNRQKVQRHFEEAQLWYLLYSLVSAAHSLQNVGSRIGDVRPENIFINQQGYIKVANLYSWPGQVSNYVKTVFENQVTYLSPEEAQSAKQGKNQSYIDKYKAQSFSIGLTLLQAATIRDVDYLYLPNKSLDTRALARLINEFLNTNFRVEDPETGHIKENTYSVPLKLVVCGLCETLPKWRLQSEQVFQWLKKHNNQIQQLSNFDPGLPPLKNMEKYQQFLRVFGGVQNQTQVKTQVQPPVNYQGNNTLQFFHQYSRLNPTPQHPQHHLPPVHLKPSQSPQKPFVPPPPRPFSQPPPLRSQNPYPPSFILPQNYNPQPLQQVQRPRTDNFGQVQNINNRVIQPSSNSNDFLRRIDEQLMRSRQSFR